MNYFKENNLYYNFVLKGRQLHISLMAGTNKAYNIHLFNQNNLDEITSYYDALTRLILSSKDDNLPSNKTQDLFCGYTMLFPMQELKEIVKTTYDAGIFSFGEVVIPIKTGPLPKEALENFTLENVSVPPGQMQRRNSEFFVPFVEENLCDIGPRLAHAKSWLKEQENTCNEFMKFEENIGYFEDILDDMMNPNESLAYNIKE